MLEKALLAAPLLITAAAVPGPGGFFWWQAVFISAAVGGYAASGIAVLTQAENVVRGAAHFSVRWSTSVCFGVLAAVVAARSGYANSAMDAAAFSGVGGLTGVAAYPSIVSGTRRAIDAFFSARD